MGCNIPAKQVLGSAEYPLHYRSAALPVRIYTMGGLRVMIDGRQRFPPHSQSTRHAKGELLKVLVALGGRAVAETRIAAALWPCAEGVGVSRRFDAALAHLLTWFKGCDVLRVENGILSLDARYCWVDTWALDRTYTTIRQMLANAAGRPREQDELIAQAGHLRRLYRGDFLARDRAQAWSLALRERLRSTFVRTMADLAEHWWLTGEPSHALCCCRDGLAVDETGQPLPQLLTRYALTQGNKPVSDHLQRYYDRRSWSAALHRAEVRPGPLIPGSIETLRPEQQTEHGPGLHWPVIPDT